ncbi:MAG: SdpI family protein [Agathobacter sp.]|nr:SdpI family protein [Agathobacter sp.]
MGFWIFMSIFNLFVPILMLLIGYMMKKHPPKDINGIIGYRTARSTKSKEAWDFAQNYCGSLWLKVSIPMIVIAIIVDALTYGRTMNVVGNVGFVFEMLQCLFLVMTIIPVEKQLKKKYG